VTPLILTLEGKGVWSGQGECKDDPSIDCQEDSNDGPVPEGEYRINAHESKDKFWRLESKVPVTGLLLSQFPPRHPRSDDRR
jgi:hypothetical protein